MKRLNDMMKAYAKGFKDMFSFQMIIMLVLPFLLSLMVSYFSWGYITAFLDAALHDDLSSQGWFVEFLIPILNGVGALIYFVVLILIMQMICSIFYAPFVIMYLYRCHYPDVSKDAGISTWQSLKKSGNIFLSFIVLVSLCIPLYFIPILNVVLLSMILFFLFKEMMVLDVVGEIITAQDYAAFLLQYKIDIGLILLSLYMLSLIPFLNMLIPIFQVLVFSHFVFLKKKDFLKLKGGI